MGSQIEALLLGSQIEALLLGSQIEALLLGSPRLSNIIITLATVVRGHSIIKLVQSSYICKEAVKAQRELLEMVIYLNAFYSPSFQIKLSNSLLVYKVKYVF